MEIRKNIMRLLLEGCPGIDMASVQKVEHYITLHYKHDLFEYQRNTQIMASQMRSDLAVTLDMMRTDPGKLSLSMPLKKTDEATRIAYDESITEFEVLVGSEHSLLECRKCKQNTVVWTQVQTRGGDEGATIFCRCLNYKCLASWKC